MTTFSGILNIKLLKIDLNQTEIDSNKNLDLFVSVDQRFVYETTIKNCDSLLNESFTSEIEEGKNIELILFNDPPRSFEDSIAKCVISFEDVLKKEKTNGGVYNVEIDLEPSGHASFIVELIEKKETTTSSQNRSSNVIRKKVHQINGHKFIATMLKQPSFCSQCGEFIFGLGLQGYSCSSCKTVVHKRCHKNVESKCKKMKKLSIDDSGNSEILPHELAERHFNLPTYCDHCGSMLYGLYKQGMQCKCCKINVHKKCRNYLPENCKRNQATAGA